MLEEIPLSAPPVCREAGYGKTDVPEKSDSISR
jgi:hypothetical protein